MMQRALYVTAALALFAVACGNKSGGEATGASSAAAASKAADVSCDAVVAKFVSFNAGAGDPEKKLWNALCAEMKPTVRSCFVGAKTEADAKACLGNEKLVK